jgi:hypothetical protein
MPEGFALHEQRLDETEVGEATAVVLIDGKQSAPQGEPKTVDRLMERLGIGSSENSLSWDIFEAVMTPGDLILLMNWRDAEAAERFQESLQLPDDVRCRRVRIVRDYGMYDRREAPQYFPDAPNRKTMHCEPIRRPPEDSRTK